LRHWLATTPELQEFFEAVPQARRMLLPLCHALGIDIDKPYGVPPVGAKPDPAPSPPQASPPQTSPPPAPPYPAEGASPSPGPAQNPPLVFSSP
jgi:hypothetical protein